MLFKKLFERFVRYQISILVTFAPNCLVTHGFKVVQNFVVIRIRNTSSEFLLIIFVPRLVVGLDNRIVLSLFLVLVFRASLTAGSVGIFGRLFIAVKRLVAVSRKEKRPQW